MGRALIINDNEFITNRTARMLEDVGWDVYTADAANFAPDVYGASQPDIVIVDIDMRGGAGFEIMAAMRRNDNGLHIVAVTRGRHEELREKVAEACGANRYVVGPVSTNKLREIIDDVSRRNGLPPAH